MIKNVIKITCNLCDYPPKEFESKEKAKEKGWAIIGQESYFDDRSFFDSCICPSCVEKIKKQHLERNRKGT